MSRLLLAGLCLCICACGSDKDIEEHKEPGIPESYLLHNGTPREPLPTPEELTRADSILDFANKSLEALAGGRFAQANALHANAQLYLHTWRLAPRPARGTTHEIEIPSGIFDQEETSRLKGLVGRMDKALNQLYGHYTALEKYVADHSIQDDGKRGRVLVSRIASAHADFIKARRSWLEMVQSQAAQAETILLREHPLERQIIDSQKIFAQFREVANLLASGSSDRSLLKAVYNNIAALHIDAAKPPFPSSPEVERLFRQFLKYVGTYQEVFSRSIDEGFHEVQRRELNKASLDCQKAYNEFAAAANKVKH